MGKVKKKSNKKTTEQFIKEAREVHGDKYDYSLVEYDGCGTKIKIICPKHGEFEQTPKNHVSRKYECFKCGLEKTRSGLIKRDKDTFIKEAREIHGDKFDYSKVEYKTNKDKVTIICPVHGEFDQVAKSHLRGFGCAKCGIEDGHRKQIKTDDEFIEEAREVHGDKYDYSKVVYRGNKENVKMICPEHGEFEQHPKTHLKSVHACPRCATIKSHEKQMGSKEDFVNKANEIHNDKYDYSLAEYKGIATKVKIICPKHGEFEQRPYGHLSGKGCKKCYLESVVHPLKGKTNLGGGHNRYTTETFIQKANEIHNNKYDYSKVKYLGNQEGVVIICPEHGEFRQTPNRHLSGSGCNLCGYNRTKNKEDDVISKSKEIHGDKYDYSKVKYENSYTKAIIICPEHGKFEQTLANHISQKQGCPKCARPGTKLEQDFIEFIKLLDINYSKNDRKTIHPYEIDVYFPDHNIGVELNGLYWHSEVYKDKNYHLDKTNKCKENNIDLIHIFEDEWLKKKEIVKSILLDKLNLTPNKIGGENCIVHEINTKRAREFCENNHLQGYVGSSIKLGLFYGDELVSVMLLKKSNGYKHKITRFCNKVSYNVTGGFNKLFNYFIKQYSPDKVISYIDKRYSNGKVHENLGFIHVHDLTPIYYYLTKCSKIRLRRTSYKGGELAEERVNRIYDCGYEKHEWVR